MPEAPEVWILSQAINAYYNYEKTHCYGKHLIVYDNENKRSGEDWSFGLNGKVKICDEDNSLVKLDSGWINGEKVSFNNDSEPIIYHGINWLMCDEDLLRKEVDTWIKSKKKLAGLMLDQSRIAGIGVAWGSEILFHAGLRPDMKVCDQNIKGLADSMLHIREKIKELYKEELNKCNDKKTFINEWFDNLYQIRDMCVYKKGSKVEVLGRSWWV